MAMQPWINGRVTFAFHNDGTISLRAQNATDKPESLFDPSQQSELAAIFEELKAIGRSTRSNSVWMRGDKKGEDGYFAGIVPNLETTYTDKKGAEKTVPFAYEVEQLAAFTPKEYRIKARWDGHKLVPVLHVYATASENSGGRRNAFTRSTQPAQPEVATKQKQNGATGSQPEYRRRAQA